MRSLRRPFRLAQIALAAGLVAGCSHTEEVKFAGEQDASNYYLNRVTSIDYASTTEEPASDAISSLAPRTILEDRKDEIWDLSLNECVQAALQNSRVLRRRFGDSRTGGDTILSNPDRTPSVYDPAIQETGVLFGGRGVEAALAAFDADFNTTAKWSHNEQIRQSLAANGSTLENDSADVISKLSKSFSYGGTLDLTQRLNYGSDRPNSNLFPSTYTGNVGASYQHPLLAGSGAEFTRIAGPVSSSFGGLSGVNQGVVIARINQDISLADFEAHLVNMVNDIQDAYWNLYLRYRIYDTVVAQRNSALRTWRDAKLKRDVGGAPGFTLEDEAQARDQYFETQALGKQKLADVYRGESALRRLMAMSVNDGRIIRPCDEPITAQLQPDWTVSIAEGLTHRVELRRQKWNIKSLELQLCAATNLVRPRLDFIAGYQVNGFGDNLLAYDDSSQGLNSFYSSVRQGNQTGWNAGFVFDLPIGLRSAKAQVRNVELRLAKARELLAAQELEVSHEIAIAFQNTAENYSIAQANINRRNAALERVRLTEANEKVGKQTTDMVLRAQASQAGAEIAYYEAIVAYTQSINAMHFKQGTLLSQNQVYMAESDWSPEAYEQALRKARQRASGYNAEHLLQTLPPEFASPENTIGLPPLGYLPQSAQSDSVGTEPPIPLPPEVEFQPSAIRALGVPSVPAAEPAPVPQNDAAVPIFPPAQPQAPKPLDGASSWRGTKNPQRPTSLMPLQAQSTTRVSR